MTESRQEHLCAAARRALPLLPELMKAAEAERLAERLRELLSRAEAGDDVAAELTTELGRETAVKNIRDRYLRTASEPGGEGYHLVPVPGPPQPIDPIIWVCPRGDVEWLQFHAGETPPPCDEHKLPLVRKDAQQ